MSTRGVKEKLGYTSCFSTTSLSLYIFQMCLYHTAYRHSLYPSMSGWPQNRLVVCLISLQQHIYHTVYRHAHCFMFLKYGSPFHLPFSLDFQHSSQECKQLENNNQPNTHTDKLKTRQPPWVLYFLVSMHTDYKGGSIHHTCLHMFLADMHSDCHQWFGYSCRKFHVHCSCSMPSP